MTEVFVVVFVVGVETVLAAVEVADNAVYHTWVYHTLQSDYLYGTQDSLGIV
jgi:hypothetical protein